MAHDADLVAKAKALMLLCGMSAKTVSGMIGVPIGTLHKWRRGRERSHIEPDRELHEALKKMVCVPRET